MNARAIWLLLAGLAAGGLTLAQLQSPDPLRGRNWAAGCTGCHASDWLSGPYQCACLVADYLRQAKPRSKVLILDANEDVISTAALFKQVWADTLA